MEYIDLARFFASFIGVVLLIVVSAWIARKLDLQKKLAGLRKDATLALVETCHIDARHKLVVVRCRDKHHVLMIGQGASLLVDSFDAPVCHVRGEKHHAA